MDRIDSDSRQITVLQQYLTTPGLSRKQTECGLTSISAPSRVYAAARIGRIRRRSHAAAPPRQQRTVMPFIHRCGHQAPRGADLHRLDCGAPRHRQLRRIAVGLVLRPSGWLCTDPTRRPGWASQREDDVRPARGGLCVVRQRLPRASDARGRDAGTARGSRLRVWSASANRTHAMRLRVTCSGAYYRWGGSPWTPPRSQRRGSADSKTRCANSAT